MNGRVAVVIPCEEAYRVFTGVLLGAVGSHAGWTIYDIALDGGQRFQVREDHVFALDATSGRPACSLSPVGSRA